MLGIIGAMEVEVEKLKEMMDGAQQPCFSL